MAPKNRPFPPSLPMSHEPDATAAFWRNDATNTLPPPDMTGTYRRHRPLAPEGIAKRRATIVGGGIAGLAAAFYLIRDAQMPGENITVIEGLSVPGGSMDGAGNAQDGYIVRGGREMNWNYDNLWDLFQDIPAVEMPEGHSVLDEYRALNDADANVSKARLMHKQGQIRNFSTLGLTKPQQWELVRLLLARKEDLDDKTITDWFSPGFLQSNFWFFWRSMFAFKNCHSLLEMKLYMHRFLDALDGLNDMSALVFPRYNQYETFILPLVNWLKARGVNFRYDTRVTDLEMTERGGQRTVTAIHAEVDGTAQVIPVGDGDLVFALPGSMTEGTAYGDMDTVPVLARGNAEPGPDSDWLLWKNLAAKSPVFGKPQKFYGDVNRSIWESVTLTCKPSPLTEKIAELSVNDPYSGRTATGGVITFTNSGWVMSVTANRQPHFRDQPDDVLVLWAYGLDMDGVGDVTGKTMADCTGREILAELCHHLGLSEHLDQIAAATKVRLALMPYITAEFMPRAAGDRPHVVPEGCTNLALLGQFVETANDVVFTMESSVRTARIGVYSLLNLPKQVPDIAPTQYDIRNLLKAARAINNGEPFPGERLLHRVLDKTYFAHILPPLPEDEPGTMRRIEEELGGLFGKGERAVQSLIDQIAGLRDKLSGGHDTKEG